MVPGKPGNTRIDGRRLTDGAAYRPGTRAFSSSSQFSTTVNCRVAEGLSKSPA